MMDPGPMASDVRDVGNVRELPHHLDLEASVLGLLLDGGQAAAMHVIRGHLEHPLHFYGRNHRMLYQACLDLDDRSERVDAEAVAALLHSTKFEVCADRLRQQEILRLRDELDGLSRDQLRALYRRRDGDRPDDDAESAFAAIGGFATLSELTTRAGSMSTADRNAKILRDLSLKRRYIYQLQHLAEEAYQTTDEFGTLIEKAGDRVLKMAKDADTGEAIIHPMPSVIDQTMAKIAEISASGGVSGVTTGYPGLDDKLMSLRAGGLYVLAARPGVGKTSFALSLVQNACTDASDVGGKDVLFFSLEVDRTDLVKKLLCGIGGIDFKALERGLLSDADSNNLSEAADQLRDWRLHLMDVADLTVQGMRSLVKRHQLEHPDLGLVVVDYLQLLRTTRRDVADYERISEISRMLKLIAMELKVPVLALSQMSRDNDKAAKPRPPRLSDLRGSGSIEQDADAVVFLHRDADTDDPDTAETGRDLKLVLAKNRFGPLGDFDLKVFPARQRFTIVESHDEESWAPPPEPIQPGLHERYEQAPAPDEDPFH